MTATPKRQLAYAVLACLAGGALALFAAGRVWAVEVIARPEPLTPVRTERSGAALVGWLSPLAWAAMAGAGALLATRRGGRGLIGGVLLVAGAAIVASGGYGLTRADGPRWPLVAALGGLLVAGAGAFAAARGRAWPIMGARYDRRDAAYAPPTTPSPPTSQDMWTALDRGQDPTASAPPPPASPAPPADPE